MQIINNHDAEPGSLRNQVSGNFNQNLELLLDDDDETSF